jgi:alpha-amylase
VFTIGEVLSNDTQYIKPYTEVLDAVLDYSTWTPLVAGFQTPFGNLSALASSVNTLQTSFKNGAKMTGSFLENHDQPRFQSLTNDSMLVRNAVAWPFVYDGIPILYYGQEQGYQGGPDPSNREAYVPDSLRCRCAHANTPGRLWPTGYQTQGKPLVAQVTALNMARKAAIAANSSFLSTPVAFPAPQASALAVAKPPLLALLTNVGSAASAQPSWSVPAGATGYAPNTDLVEVLGCTKVTTDAQGALSATAAGGAPMVFLPASALTKGGALCPQLATGSGNATASPSSGGSGSSTAGAASPSGSAHSGARGSSSGASMVVSAVLAAAGAFLFA